MITKLFKSFFSGAKAQKEPQAPYKIEAPEPTPVQIINAAEGSAVQTTAPVVESAPAIPAKKAPAARKEATAKPKKPRKPKVPKE